MCCGIILWNMRLCILIYSIELIIDVSGVRNSCDILFKKLVLFISFFSAKSLSSFIKLYSFIDGLSI